MHTAVLGVTPPMNRTRKRLRQSRQLPVAIFKPAKRLVLPTLLCLCQHLRAREADDGLEVDGHRPPATVTTPQPPAHPRQ